MEEKTTKELTEELSKREGVEILFVEPYKKYEIITDTQKIVGTGPVEILINKD